MATYSIDTSSLIHAWVRAYPPDVFPSFWDRFDECTTSGVVIASREVLTELEVKADDLFKWAKERENIFHEIDDAVQASVTNLVAKYPKLVDERTNRSAGDPWVIGLAAVHALKVVTQEDGGSAQRPKIPFVCAAEGIQCINLLGLIRELGWRI